MIWEQDLIEDIRTNTDFDDQDGGIPHPMGYTSWDIAKEFSTTNAAFLKEYFMHVKDHCTAILEIGVCRNEGHSSTHVLLNNKNPDTVYVGIDLDDKSFLDNADKNVYTLKTSSSNVEENMAKFKELGIEEFDFIFIDGWHSINQILIDWEYTSMLSDAGIVALHDVTTHPGPTAFIKALDKDKWNVEENLSPEDHGIGFAWRK